MKTFKSIYIAVLIASVASGCDRQADVPGMQDGRYSLSVGAELYNYPVSRTTGTDGIDFDFPVEAGEYPFTLSLDDVTKDMSLSLASDGASISYKNENDKFSVEILEYNASIGGDGISNIPLAFVKTFNDNQYSFGFKAPVALAETKLTPVKDENIATLNLPLKVDVTGLMISFTLYGINPVSITPKVGGNTEPIAISANDEKSGALFYKTGDDGSAQYYTVLIPFKEKTGVIEAETVVAVLSDGNKEYSISLPKDKPLNLSSGKLYTMDVMQNLETELVTVSCGINDWGVENFSSAVAGKDYDYDEASNTYKIYSAAGLEEWRKKSASGNSEQGTLVCANAVLMNDIDMSGVEWPSCCRATSKQAYTGVFDGNGHKIINLAVYATWDGVGFIGSMTTGTIKNLTIDGVEVTTGPTQSTSNMGAVVGDVAVGGTIDNCHVIFHPDSRIMARKTDISVPNTSQGTFYGGGIVGKCLGTLQNCTVKAEGEPQEIEGTIGFDNTPNKYHIQALSSAGGVVGYTQGIDLINCHASGVHVYGTVVGGVVAEFKSNSTSNIIACSSSNVYITGFKENNKPSGMYVRAGGLVGRINKVSDNPNVHIAGCYSVGAEVMMDTNQESGGLVGRQDAGTAYFTSCYSSPKALSGHESRTYNIMGQGSSNFKQVYATQLPEPVKNHGSKLENLSDVQSYIENLNLWLENPNQDDRNTQFEALSWQYEISDNNPFPLVIQPKNP